MTEHNEPKLIFENDGWVIYVEDYDMVRVYTTHVKCLSAKDTNEAFNSWYMGDVTPTCILGEKAVPEEIQGLVTLYWYGKGGK